jgi:phosphoesterase RecJ-like protein
MFEQVLSVIKEYDRIIIHRHLKPDGDAIGAQIGLKHIIKENFPTKEVYAVGDGAGRYSFMDDSVADVIADDCYKGALAIILDLSAPNLVSDERYKLADKTVRIDHHLFIETFTDIEVIDSSYESCCGLIAEFARECNLKVNALAGKSLFTGMVTDSGRFRYDSAGSRTFALASFLLQSGFSTADIYKELYADDFEFIRLRASFILKIAFTPKNVAYIYTTKEEFEATGKDSFTISRGMVNTMADLKGVDIWVNFTEVADSVLCEIRSSKYNINRIAVKYGGGGNEKASGATLKDKSEAISLLNDLNDLIGD